MLEITNNKTSGVPVWEPVYEDETITQAGAGTLPAGALLGRITADNKLKEYDSVAVDGSEVAIAVLRDDLVFAGAGDLACRVIVSGRVRRGDLVHVGVGAITDAESDALRDYGIVPLRTQQLSELDNQ